MKVYHAILTGKGFFIKTDRQPSGGGVLTSQYLHDITLNYALFAAFNSRGIALPENPQYLKDLITFFERFPVYAYPTMIHGYQKTENINVIPSTRSITDRENKDNVPKLNRWHGYRQFLAVTTILTEVDLPFSFYCRLGKKRSLVEVQLEEVQFQINTGTCHVGLISPLLHSGLVYDEGTLLPMNPSPLFVGSVTGEYINYRIGKDSVCKPLQFTLHTFKGFQ